MIFNHYKMFHTLISLLILFCVSSHSLAQTTPKDTAGIDWKTVGMKGQQVKLKNGKTIVVPVKVTPYGGDAKNKDLGKWVIHYGYWAKLKNGKMIQLWVPEDKPPPEAPKKIKDNWDDLTGWCHGTTFNTGAYQIGGSHVPEILQAGWEQIECDGLGKDDIIVYESDGSDEKKYGKSGNINHTALSNGGTPLTFTSKDGPSPKKTDETIANMDRKYKPGNVTKCYRKKP